MQGGHSPGLRMVKVPINFWTLQRFLNLALFVPRFRLVMEAWSEPDRSRLPVALCSTQICKVDRVWLEPDTEEDWEIMVRTVRVMKYFRSKS